VVVVVVVVGGGTHGGSAGFVQEQNVSPLILHCSMTDFLQSLKAAPVKAPHAELTSSAHCFEPQSGGAAPAPETKTPAASATANNVTTAFLVIVAPPHMARSVREIDIDLGNRYDSHVCTRWSREFLASFVGRPGARWTGQARLAILWAELLEPTDLKARWRLARLAGL
jgi:hypothetical protein